MSLATQSKKFYVGLGYAREFICAADSAEDAVVRYWTQKVKSILHVPADHVPWPLFGFQFEYSVHQGNIDEFETIPAAMAYHRADEITQDVVELACIRMHGILGLKQFKDAIEEWRPADGK